MLKASIVILSFNQEKYIEAALRSALEQDYPNLEILIGDDASSDGTRLLIEKVLSTHPSAHLARLLPLAPNLGLVGNWERLVRNATGDFIVAQAGDDVSMPRRTAQIAHIFSANKDVMAVLSQVRIIDGNSAVLRETFEQGRPSFGKYLRNPRRDGFDFWCGAPVLGACAAYRRRLHDDFGPLIRAHSEDEAYVYRALLLGCVAYTDEILLEWRWHGRNLSVGSLMNEGSVKTALERRAKSALMRQESCDQHMIDLQKAFASKLIKADDFHAEKTKIEAMRAIQGLGYASVSPRAPFSVWLAEARMLISANGYGLAVWRYLLRTFVKKLLPGSIRLSYSRPVR